MKKYLRLIWIELRKGKEYSLNFIGQLLHLPLQLLIIYFIWKFVFQNKAVIANYTFNDMVQYYFLLKIFESAIMPVGVVAYEVWSDINHGRLNLFLSKPLYYPLYNYFTKIGYFIWGLFSGLLFLSVFGFIIPLAIELTVEKILLSILSALFGMVIMYALFFYVGSLTFWVENILTLRDNMWNVIRILSGQIFPIALFPGFLQVIAEHLPFQYIYYIPISIFQGKLNGPLLYEELTKQSLWVVVLLLIMILVWQIGIKRYSAQNG